MDDDVRNARRTADDAIYVGENRYAEPKEIFKFLGQRIAPYARKDASFLDVGCAAGELLYYVHGQFTELQLWGVDVSELMLAKAREHVPTAVFERRDILSAPCPTDRQYDIVTCVGVVQIFDDLHVPLKNLVSRVRPGGVLFVEGIVNPHPIDVIVRYRTVDPEYSAWEPGWNLWSTITFDRVLNNIDGVEWQWHDFRLPFAVPKKPDPMRTWTIRTEENPFQLVNGASQLITTKVLEVRVKEETVSR